MLACCWGWRAGHHWSSVRAAAGGITICGVVAMRQRRAWGQDWSCLWGQVGIAARALQAKHSRAARCSWPGSDGLRVLTLLPAALLQWLGREQDCHLVVTCKCKQSPAGWTACMPGLLLLPDLLSQTSACQAMVCWTHTATAATHCTHHSAALCVVAPATVPAGRPACRARHSTVCCSRTRAPATLAINPAAVAIMHLLRLLSPRQR